MPDDYGESMQMPDGTAAVRVATVSVQVIDMEKRGGRWRKPLPLWAQALAPYIPALAGIVLLVVLAVALPAPWLNRAALAEALALVAYEVAYEAWARRTRPRFSRIVSGPFGGVDAVEQGGGDT